MVSIIMPVFNTGIYLIDAIESVLNQQPFPGCANLPSSELLVIDDHSTDSKTLAILNDFSDFDSRIKIIKILKKSTNKRCVWCQKYRHYPCKW